MLVKYKYKKSTCLNQRTGMSDQSFFRLLVGTILLLIGLSGAFLPSSGGAKGDNRPLVETPAAQASTVEGGLDPMLCALKDVTCPTEVTTAPTKSAQKVIKVKIASISNEKIELSKQVCSAKGFNDDMCWKVLYAMHIQETTGDCSVVGDQGRSIGCFQIQVKLHGVSKVCARDYKCSAIWSLNNLVAHGYPEYRGRAIALHNGRGVMAQKYYQEVKYKMSSL